MKTNRSSRILAFAFVTALLVALVVATGISAGASEKFPIIDVNEGYLSTDLADCPDGHTEVIDEAVEPTCTEAGLTEGSHCSVCGEIIVAQQTVPALGHSYVEIENTATCGMNGTATYECEGCGVRYSEDVPFKGHTYESEESTIFVGATCTTDGYYAFTCDVCGVKSVTTDYDADGEIDYPAYGCYGGVATCSSKALCQECNNEYGSLAECEFIYVADGKGSHNAVCSVNSNHNKIETCADESGANHCVSDEVCGKCSFVIAKAEGHVGGVATCTSTGVCTSCGLEYLEMTDHNWNWSPDDEEPNPIQCTEPQVCLDCGFRGGLEAGHEHGTTFFTKDQCQNCGLVDTKSVAIKAGAVVAALVIIIIVIKTWGAVPTTTPIWRRIFR